MSNYNTFTHLSDSLTVESVLRGTKGFKNFVNDKSIASFPKGQPAQQLAKLPLKSRLSYSAKRSAEQAATMRSDGFCRKV